MAFSLYCTNISFYSVTAQLCHTFEQFVIIYFSGDIWRPYKECPHQTRADIGTCLEQMEKICRASKHRATKVVRITLDNLEAVLDLVPNLKVIHLLRDPRAIANSRITTSWYSLPDAEKGNPMMLSRDVEDLCSRMTYDLRASVLLKKKFPQRFSLVMFEDLQENLSYKASLLYDFLGISTQDLSAKLSNMSAILKEEHTVSDASGDFANWWRHQLSFASITVVQDKCKDLLSKLGYRLFSSEEEVRQTSVSSFNFADSLLLENIQQTFSYDNL